MEVVVKRSVTQPKGSDHAIGVKCGVRATCAVNRRADVEVTVALAGER